MNPPSSPNKTPERMSAQVAGWRSDGRWWALIAQLGRWAAQWRDNFLDSSTMADGRGVSPGECNISAKIFGSPGLTPPPALY